MVFKSKYHPIQGNIQRVDNLKVRGFVSMKLNILEKLKLTIDYYKELNSKMKVENEKFPGQMKEVIEGIKDLEDQYYEIIKK